MTAYEKFFQNLKQELGKPTLFPIWPEFTAEYDVEEYAFIAIPGLGAVLLLNCGTCDGPSDIRHATCRNCVATRQAKAEDHTPKQKTQSLALCRFFKAPENSVSTPE